MANLPTVHTKPSKYYLRLPVTKSYNRTGGSHSRGRCCWRWQSYRCQRCFHGFLDSIGRLLRTLWATRRYSTSTLASNNIQQLWVSSFLMAHQHNISYAVPYAGSSPSSWGSSGTWPGWIPRKTTIMSSLPHYVHHLTGGDPPVIQELLGWERLGRTYSHRISGFIRHGGRQRREIDTWHQVVSTATLS